ncbi:DNA phosphorothioation-dependent restriction protein DptH [Kushneria marisflavi]|uniref:DNA phosphorothioation-dependent restriction protein DptH n=1 Tax=Kushneria marisflavi TaxID=157779 RepID=A0A240UPX6_9GAMM|nr:DNA phosphorothioation-dependent restriction protein DptH [Kushneria marisflavi]ART63123.1 DNA phosphorothioation-dependent restriction protein DptH [Kushneria marisflavi]RKD84623.1 DNA phosphorothioation-dependent restriction protein DptH [Kushneria marisflavi]
MSEKRFESFLVENLKNWLTGRVKAGERFQFRSTDPDNTIELLSALHEAADGSIMDGKTKINYLLVDNIKVLIAGHTEEYGVEDDCYTENYLAKLRDDVVNWESSLLMIHNSLLDTITNSTFDLAKHGAVWSVEGIKQQLDSLIDDSMSNQKTSRCLLDFQAEVVESDNASIFGYRSLYESMTDGELRFDELGLFNDPRLTDDWAAQGENFNLKQIERRLEENRKLRSEIEFEIEHHSEELEDRLTQFGSRFIKENFGNGSEAWKEKTFDEYTNEIEKQKEQVLELDEISTTTGFLQRRSKRDKGAGLRDIHILLEADQSSENFDISIKFSGSRTEARQFSINPSKMSKTVFLDHKAHNNKTKLNIRGTISDQPAFFTVKLSRESNSEQYSFHCAIVPQGVFYLEDMVNKFLINRSKQALVLQSSQQSVVVNPNAEDVKTLVDNQECVDISLYKKIDFQQLYDESDEVRFQLKSGDAELEVMVEGEPAKQNLVLPLLADTSRTKHLLCDDYYATYKPGKSTVVLDNQEIKQVFLREQLLSIEYDFIEDELILWDENSKVSSKADILKDSGFVELYEKYVAFLRYFKACNRRTLPSLESWGPKVTGLAKAYIDAYLNYLGALETGKTLTSSERVVTKLGIASITDSREGRQKQYLTPFHPVVLSYYLNLIDAIQEDGEQYSYKSLPDVTMKRLNPRGLVPHLYDSRQGYSYTQSVNENPFWLEIVPKEDSSFEYVIKLVRHKIEEFVETFKKLFEEVPAAPILINSINNAENRELFRGILAYYNDRLDDGRRIHVNLYDDDEVDTEFDFFAEMATYDEIKNRYGLDKGAAKRNADTIVDVLRTHLSFSKFRNGQVDSQKYAHLSFFRNNQLVDPRNNDVDEHISGMSCGGLLAGESSLKENEFYFTGLGMKGVDCSDKPHLMVAKGFSRLWRPSIVSGDAYDNNSAIRLSVSTSVREQLERSYDSSIWVTIIDPKVTLDFFQGSSDIILIHYSDQYTSSSGYDAITVTKQSNLYKSVLGNAGESLIREFNAFNGEWLLQMVSDPHREELGKQGVIASYKTVAIMLSQSDICWVPLSVAEMIRVAGNIGLAMSESDFSRRNSSSRHGPISDDILFAGFKNGKLYLLPVEAKAGSRPDFRKACTQALELKHYMETILGQDNLAGRLFRGLFIRQILLQVEKYQLYEVFDNTHFDSFLDERETWLDGTYSIGQLTDYPDGMVVALINSDACFSESYEESDGVLKVEIPISMMDTLIHTSYQVLKRNILEGRSLRIPKKYMLGTQHQGNEDMPEQEGLGGIQTILFGDEPAAYDENDNSTVESETTETALETKSELTQPLTVQFGTDVQTQQPVIWEPTNTEKLFNTNTGIIGTMGTGKTQFTKSLITQLVHNQHNNVGGTDIGILIFDYKADYVKDDFVAATNAKVFDLFHLPFNPFAVFGNRPMQPMHTANLFRTTIAKAFGLGPRQQNKVRTLVMDAYEAAGIYPQDSSTWVKPAPTLADIWEVFQSQEKVEQDSLYAALDDLIGFEIFEPDTRKTQSLYDLVDGVTVINLSGYDPSIQNLVVALTLDLFYTQMHQQGSSRLEGSLRQISKMILVDEADNFMSQDFDSLKKILKEGREFGVGTILSTQELTHFKTGDNDYSTLILSWVIHQVANIKSQEIKAIFNTPSKQSEEFHMGEIRKLEKHYSLYIDGKKKVSKIKDLAFWEFLELN